MKTKLQQAIQKFMEQSQKELESYVASKESKMCKNCQNNIKKLENSPYFQEANPKSIEIPSDEDFLWDLDYLTRVSEHNGMPCITTFDSCPTCHTKFYSSFDGFDADIHYNYKTPNLEDVDSNVDLLKVERDVLKQTMPAFLKDYFKDDIEEVALYVSLTPQKKRSNHDQLIKIYEETDTPIEKADNVSCYLSEKDAFEDSRMGGIFEKEFLQKFNYPINEIEFEYNSYLEEIDVRIDVKKIKNPLFFDIFRKQFVAYDELDLENIHMAQRNHETYNFFSELRSVGNYGGFEGPDTMVETIEEEFEKVLEAIMVKKFGEQYQAYKEAENEKATRWDDFINGMKEYGKEKAKEKEQEKPKKPTELEGFKTFENIIVKKAPYTGMKAVIKRINFQNKKLEVQMFGDDERDNILKFAPKDCEKI